MRKYTFFLMLFLALWMLCSCAFLPRLPESSTVPADTAPSTTESTAPSTTESTAPSTTEAPTEPPTETEPSTEPLPEHSPLYLPEYTVEDVIAYFNEVVLSVEYNNGDGDPSLVQKWISPIYYHLEGSPSEQDLQTLEDFLAQLNEIPGFPGLYPAEEGDFANLTLYFVEREPFEELFSQAVHGDFANGAVEFWYYTDSNEIHTASIGICLDVDQSARLSILPEEIINMLGITDTVLREDSIVYQYSDENTDLSDMDLLILKLLYDPRIQCGMDAAACEEILRELYY